MNNKIGFLSELMAAVTEQGNDSERASQALREAIIEFGSDTPDNRTCRDCLEVGTYRTSDQVFRGPGLISSGESLSTVINHTEGCPIPDQVKMALPDVTQEEWDAVLRFCTLVMTALEQKS